MSDEGACQVGTGRWIAYVHGLVPPDELGELEAHLDRCGSCRETLETMRAMEARGELPDPPATSLPWGRYGPMLTPEDRARLYPDGPPWRLFGSVLFWFAAAAAMAYAFANLSERLTRGPRSNGPAAHGSPQSVRKLPADFR